MTDLHHLRTPRTLGGIPSERPLPQAFAHAWARHNPPNLGLHRSDTGSDKLGGFTGGEDRIPKALRSSRTPSLFQHGLIQPILLERLDKGETLGGTPIDLPCNAKLVSESPPSIFIRLKWVTGDLMSLPDPDQHRISGGIADMEALTIHGFPPAPSRL
jgi:hypothetical protein